MREREENLGPRGCISQLIITGHGQRGQIEHCLTSDMLKKPDDYPGLQKCLDFLKGRMCDESEGISIRCCYVAKGAEGRKFIDRLAKATCADVWAWTDMFSVVPHGDTMKASPDNPPLHMAEGFPFKDTWAGGLYFALLPR